MQNEMEKEVHTKTQRLIEKVLNFCQNITQYEKLKNKALSVSTTNTNNSVTLNLYNSDLPDSLVFPFEINLELGGMSLISETKIISQGLTCLG